MSNAAGSRIASIDQLRGYAIAGMIFVNWLGNFKSMPWAFDHHRHGPMSYADTIAPLFLFVVGMGFRLSFLRRSERGTAWDARKHLAKRYVTLIVVAIAYYGPDFCVDIWDALTYIAVAALLILPVIDRSVSVRLIVSGVYAALFWIASSQFGYYEWTMARSIDGGPLGPLSWTIPLVFGTFAWDLYAAADGKRLIRWFASLGIGLILIGYLGVGLERMGYAVEPYNLQSQRGGTVPYMIASTGASFLAALLFYWVVDIRGWSVPTLSTLGSNALVIYMVQGVVLGEMHHQFPRDSSAIWALCGFALVYTLCWAAARHLAKQNIIIKL